MKLPQVTVNEPRRDYTPVRNVAMQNLLRIARGENPDPVEMISGLAQANTQVQKDFQLALTAAKAAALTIPTQPPDAKNPGNPKPSPDGGKYSYTRTGEQAPTPKVGKAVEIALKQLGKPYVWATAGPKSFDCSGLIEWAFEQAGITTPGRLTTYSMAKLGKSVKGSAMLPGDWVITNGGKHVVMYIGGNEVIAAPHSGTDVQVQKLDDHRSGIVDVRRFP